MDQCLIGPGVVEGRGHVHVTIGQDEQRPLETGEQHHYKHTHAQQCIVGGGVSVVTVLPELSGGHVVSGEEAVSGVPQVLTELLVQLLRTRRRKRQHLFIYLQVL